MNVLNPKSVSMNELYGAFDLATFEWADGILSNIFRQCAQDEKPDEKWIILDGPVDTLWIESMNTVMDDNKTLTLINGDRISMSNEMSLCFEVQDLAVASPATVSRAGMIYCDHLDLGWQPASKSWVQKRFGEDKEQSQFFERLFEKYVEPTLKYKSRNIVEPVVIADTNAVQSAMKLFDALATKENGIDLNAEGYEVVAERMFLFSCVWSIGAAADVAGREKLDNFIRDLESQFPPARTIYDYFVDPKSGEWKLWEENVPQGWRPTRGMEFFKIIVPTVDTVRNSYVVKSLIKSGERVMVTGDTGTGKTILMEQIISSMCEVDGSQYSSLTINFSSATSSRITQDIIEGAMEKKTKDKFGPPGGKTLLTFVDDFNMPQKDTFGSQPPLELLRQWIGYGGFYNRAKQSWHYILDLHLLASMGYPGGGRSVISERFRADSTWSTLRPATQTR